jgi:hypothetical protein
MKNTNYNISVSSQSSILTAGFVVTRPILYCLPDFTIWLITSNTGDKNE